MPRLINNANPESAKSHNGIDGEEYDLFFSDEFKVEGRSFYPGASLPPSLPTILLQLPLYFR